jgi:replicative DNA helicase
MRERDRRRSITFLPDFGKVPPQSNDMEMAVLGICMVYPDSIHEIRMIPEMFYKDAHQKIFKAILDVSAKGLVDLLTVTERLRAFNELDAAGGPVYITGLTEGIYTDKMIDIYSKVVKEKFYKRELIRISTEVQNRAFDDTYDIAELWEYTEKSIFELSDETHSQEPIHISQGVDELIEEVRQIYEKEKSLVGIPSGFTTIDRITGGWQPANLIVIASRPSMGKTALALALTANPAKMNYPACMFSLEMSRIELVTRFMSGSSGYANIEIRNARVDFDRFVNSSHEIAGMPVWIDDTPAIGLMELRSKIRKQVMKNDIKLVIVDYMQLMSAEAKSREQEVSIISRGLKAIAKDFNLPVIALSQLNRQVEDRADKRPRLADLRESGSIEQDADIVCFIYRPAVYNIRTITYEGLEISSQNLMMIDCAKNRNGALFSIPLYHNSSLSVIQEEMFELHNEPF